MYAIINACMQVLRAGALACAEKKQGNLNKIREGFRDVESKGDIDESMENCIRH